MAVLDHNDNSVSWLAHRADFALGERSMRVLKGALLTAATILGVTLAIAADPIFNLFA